MSQPQMILVATDFSASADEAWQVACQLARATKARLLVLHVIPPQVAGYEAVLQGLPVTQYRQQAERAIQKYQCAEIPVERRLEEGEPVETILRVARDIGADCIVVGAHGHGWVARMLLGGVAERILRRAPGLVLVVQSRPTSRLHEPAA
ncbi:Putative universal stress protein [bacterium HR36]|nr:Putative universal stress protein [bacterium HR36]